MNPEQALNVLAQMAAHAHAPLSDHQMAQQAVAILRDAISPKDVMEGGAKSDDVG